MSSEVDVVDDAQIAQDGHDLALDLSHAVRGQAFAVCEKMSM
jgi:hypothetical protein